MNNKVIQRRTVFYAFCLLVCFILLSCSYSNTPSRNEDIVAQSLGVPIDNYYYLEWISDNKLILSKMSEDFSFQYFIVDIATGKLTEVTLPSLPYCSKQIYKFPYALPNGRVAFSVTCFGYWQDRPTGLDIAYFLVAYDLASMRIEKIVSEPLLEQVGDGRFTWNPEMTQGIVAGASLFGTLYWVTPSASLPMTVTIDMGGNSWSLDENVYILQTDADSVDVGIARAPAWSHHGNIIAFVASPQAIGKSGVSRLEGAYQLYFMDSVKLNPQSVLQELYSPHLLAWSPDDMWLLMITSIESRNERGIWLYSPTLDLIKPVARGEFQDASWSPDGQKIMAITNIQCPKVPCLQSEVVMYDVSSLLD